jgi:hypothetical protein
MKLISTRRRRISFLWQILLLIKRMKLTNKKKEKKKKAKEYIEK